MLFSVIYGLAASVLQMLHDFSVMSYLAVNFVSVKIVSNSIINHRHTFLSSVLPVYPFVFLLHILPFPSSSFHIYTFLLRSE